MFTVSLLVLILVRAALQVLKKCNKKSLQHFILDIFGNAG